MMKLMRAGIALAMVTIAGCHLLIGYRDGVLAPCLVDGSRNGEETGVDCGGSCPACPDGEGCVVGTDCTSLVCLGGTCRPATCEDGVQNGAEVDMDCGGPESGCATCEPGRRCESEADCESRFCKDGACVDYHVWSKRFAYSGSINVTGLAAGPSGEAFLAMSFTDKITIENDIIFGGQDSDFAIVAFDEGGRYAWGEGFGDNAEQYGPALALSSSGDIVLAGGLSGSVSFDNTLTSAGSYDVLLAKLGRTGAPVWSRHFGDTAAEVASAIAGDGVGNVVMAGQFVSMVDFGGGSLTSADGQDVFLASFNSAGDHLWSRRFGGPGDQGVYSIDAHDGGDTAISGRNCGEVQFGSINLSQKSCGDGFVVKMDEFGEPRWARQFSPVSPNGFIGFIPYVAIDPVGNVVVAGTVLDGVYMDEDLLGPPGSPNDIVLAKFNTMGELLWSRRFGGDGVDTVAGVAVDSDANIVMFGTFESAIDFGGDELTVVGEPGPGESSLFVVKLDPSGGHRWSRAFGGTGDHSATKIAAVGSEHVIVVGKFNGSIDFGGGVITSQGSFEIYLAALRLP